MNAVLLVLRSKLLRDVLRRLLTDSGFSIPAEAADPESFLAELGPARYGEGDFILIDAAFCVENHPPLRQIVNAVGPARLVILTDEPGVDRISSENIAISTGILTFGIAADAMVRALRLMQRGERVVQHSLMQSLLARAARAPADVGDREQPPPRDLGAQTPSAREAQILSYLLGGHSNKTIARKLGVTEATVKVHLRGLLRKICVANRTQAAIWALKHGYTTEQPPAAELAAVPGSRGHGGAKAPAPDWNPPARTPLRSGSPPGADPYSALGSRSPRKLAST